jgi:hypothetical protein
MRSADRHLSTGSVWASAKCIDSMLFGFSALEYGMMRVRDTANVGNPNTYIA